MKSSICCLTNFENVYHCQATTSKPIRLSLWYFMASKQNCQYFAALKRPISYLLNTFRY